ncbi:MAG: transaldolase family protein, partial [Candidatus Omnitrophota bacterium]
MFRRKTFKALAVFLLPIFIINNAAMAQGMLGKGAQSFEISEINEENLSPYIISKALSDDEKGGALVERTTNISRWSIRQEIKIFFERGEEYARTELQLDVDDAAMRRILWAAYEITYKSAMKNAGRGGDIIRAAVLEGKFKIAEKAYQDAYAQSVASQPADPRSIFSALESGIGAKNTDSEPETSFFNFEQRDTISRNSPTGNPNIDNIHRMYEAVEKNKGYKVVIIACPNEDMANFWQNRLDSLKGRIIGTETLVYAIPFPPDWNGAGGQVLVTLYCWQEAIRRAKGAGVDIEEIKRSDKDSIAVYHTIGKGTRTYPAPAVEVNAKSAVNVPALVVIDEENKNMMMLEAVIFATQILAESRENRLSNFWTDHFVIPSGDMKSPNTHHVEMMSIDHKIPAQNNEKAWQQDELDQYGLLIHNYPEKGDVQVKEKFTHQEAVEHLYPLADGAPREDGIQAGEVHGISLGSHSISWEFVETLEAYHGQELAEHRGFVNTDPDIWQPMSSDQTQFIKRFEKNDVPNDQNQAYLDAGSRYDEMQRLKQDFLDARELVRDERRMIGYVETGLNTWSWDFGKVIDLVHNFSKMTEGSPQAQGMRLFFGDSQVIDREHIGEVYVENSIYIGNDIKKGWVRNSIVVNTRATELNAENAIVIDGRAFRLDAKDNSFAYRVLHPGVLRLEKDEVAATVAQPGRGMFLLKTDTSRAGDKDWAVELPFNLFTYEEVYNGNQSYPMKEMEHFRETYGKFFFGIFREYRHWLTDAVSKQEQVTIDDRIGAMREIFVRGLEAIKPSRALELLLWAETLQYMPEIKISAKEAVARIFRTDIHPLDDIFDAQAEAFVNNANSECIQQGLASEDESRKSPTAGTSDEAPTATFEVNGTTVQNVPIVGGTLTDTLEDLGLAAEAIYANPEDNAVLVNGTAVTGNVRLNKNDVVTINYLSPLAFLRGPDNPDGQHFYLDDYPPSPEAINVRILVAGMMGITTNLIIFEQAAASGQFDDAIGAQVAAGNEDPADVYDKVTMPAFAEYAEVIGANTTDGDGKVKGTASYEVRPNDLHDPVATARQQIAITALEPDTAMHKTPSTAAGLAAILANMFDKILTRDNMTLMFGFDQWLESQYTQIEKLEERVKRGLPVDKYFGVDSFFVSRTDLLISAIFDRLIAQGIVSGKDKEAFESVRNLVAVSMGKRVAEWNEYVYSPAYALPKETLPEDYRKLDVLRRRFNAVNKACQARFGHTIRPRVPLWASTLAKPAQEKQGVDILIYAVNLMGRNSVDTMPGALVKAIERRFAGMTNEEKKRAMRALDNAALDERIITQYRPDGDHTYADKTAPEVLEIINDLLTKYSGAILGVTGTHPFKERADESIRDEIAAYNESLKQLRDEGVLPDDLYQQERVPIEDDYFLVTLDVLARLLTWTGGDQFIKAY